MELASVLTPFNDHNLVLAAQVSVEEVVIRCPGSDLAEIDALQARVESHGLRIADGARPLPT